MATAGPEKPPLLERHKNLLVILLIIAIAGGSAAFILRRPAPVTITIVPPPPTATPAPTTTPAPSATPGPIQVYVTGAVQNPESLVTVPYGSRVIDAIEAAGGLAAAADQERVNLAQLLRDGDQVHVFYASVGPVQDSGSAAAPGEVALPTPNDTGIIYINTASVEELDRLPRIGVAIAERIIAYREEHGPFLSLDDLANVSGIGPATLRELAPLVSFELR